MKGAQGSRFQEDGMTGSVRSSGTYPGEAEAGGGDRPARTPAQVYSLVIGATLVLAGILGFIVDADFDVGANVQGKDLVLFEVNGWHNLIHIASGLAGLALAGSRRTALLFALGFGSTYLAVTIWGLIAGDNILFGLAPINPADNILHLLISLAGILAGLASRERDPAAVTAK
jgi:hypothetical protein